MTSRHRERHTGNPTWLVVTRSADDPQPPSFYLESYLSGKGVGTSKYIDDVVTPNYVERRRMGDIILNDFRVSTVSRQSASMTLGYSGGKDSGGYRCSWSGDLAARVELMGLAPDSSMNFIDDQGPYLVMLAQAKINKDSVMSGEVLADIGRTIGMIRKPFSSARRILGNCLKDARKSYGKTFRSVQKANASAWLEYRYGMTPLLLDGTQIVENALSMKARQMKRRIVFRTSNVKTRNAVSTFAGVGVPGFPWLVSGSVRVDRTVKTDAGVIVEFAEASTARQLATDFSVTPEALNPLIWELMPFSFVVDWFVSVGPLLSALALPPHVRVAGNWVTSVDRQTLTYASSDLTEYVASLDRNVHGSFGGSVSTSQTAHRRCNLALPPYPVILPEFSSITHAVDAAALMTSPILATLKKLRH